MFPTTGTGSGITITRTEPGVSVLASGFTYDVIGDDLGREAQAEITDSDPQADSCWLRHPDRRIGERLPIGRPIVADRAIGASILSVPGIAKALDLAAPETIQLAPLNGGRAVAFPPITNASATL